jgi:[ribosomal protein S5]-alanine N-acetyltransferase
MVFLRTSQQTEDQQVVRGRGLILRPPAPSDYSAWSDLRAKSREHLVPWEPQWERDELDRGTYRRRLKLYAQEARDDLGYAFFIIATPGSPLLPAPGSAHEASSEVLVGGLRLSNVRRGVSQAATLGYWLGQSYVDRGLMTAAVAAVIPFCFGRLMLHRLEAACLPDNIRSRRVLERNGFEVEGVARDYIKINGVWRDHILYGAVASP